MSPLIDISCPKSKFHLSPSVLTWLTGPSIGTRPQPRWSSS